MLMEGFTDWKFHTNNGAMVDAVEDMMVSIRYKSDRHHRDSSKTGTLPVLLVLLQNPY